MGLRSFGRATWLSALQVLTICKLFANSDDNTADRGCSERRIFVVQVSADIKAA